MAFFAIALLCTTVRGPLYAATGVLVPFEIGAENAINLLHKNGIGCRIHRVYSRYPDNFASVHVPSKYVKQARTILTEDAKRRSFNYASIEGFQGHLGPPETDDWLRLKLDVDIEHIDSDPTLKLDSNLRGLVRCALGSGKAPYDDPHVVQVYCYKPIYWNRAGELDCGYEAYVKVRFAPDVRDAIYRLAAFEQGRIVVSRHRDGP